MKKIQTFIENLFNIDSNTSTTLILTLLTFISGYFISYIIYSISRYSNRKSIRKLTFLILKSLTKSFSKTESSIETTIQKLESGVWNIDYNLFFEISVMKEITFKECHNAFFNGLENFFFSNDLKRKSFTLLWSLIISIETYQNELRTHFQNYLQKYNDFDKIRNQEIDEIRKYWERILKPLRKSPTKVDAREKLYMIELNKIILKFQEFNPTQIILPEIQFNNLILPIKQLNEEFQDLTISTELGDLLIRYHVSYMNMIATKGALEGQLEEFRLFYRGSKRRSIKIISILEHKFSLR